ncbi:hypothetical protein SDC9_131868 [bioreactor metagenome]|uniref:Uncharacterized protein n=1 Tax=bioreactor metagenome TaxID=1076179 RepID=A0A645D866_9ZZZZ
MGQQAVQLRLLRDLIVVRGKAPGGNQRGHGDVKRAAGGVAVFNCGGDQLRDVRVLRRHAGPGIQPGNGAVHARAGKAQVQTVQLIAHHAHGALGVAVVDGDGHIGVHGIKFGGGAVLLRTGGKAAYQRRAQRGGKQTSHVSSSSL